MITRSQKIRLGLFVLVSMVLLFILLAAVLGSTVFADRDVYEIDYDISVSGLEVGAPVKYNGVRVGRVDRIWINPEKVSQTRVAISLQKGTPIKENTKAILNVQGITGLRFIELVGGTSSSRTMPPDSIIKAGTSVVDKLTGRAETLSLKAELLVNQMVELTGDENRALVADVLERSGSLMNTLDRTITKNSDLLTSTLENINRASAKLVLAIDELRAVSKETSLAIASIRRKVEGVLDEKRVIGVLDDTRKMIGEARKRLGEDELGRFTKALNKVAKRTDALVEKLDLLVARGRQDLRATLRYLAETAENARDFSRLIRDDPSLLLRSQEKRGRELP